MAHIKKMTDKPRSLPWRAHINRKGHKPLVKMFLNREEAELWAAEQERSIRLAGLPLTINDLKKVTVADIVGRYLKDVTPTKGCHVSEANVLTNFLKRPISSLSLAQISKKNAYSYVSERLKETWRGNPITPRTVRREINSLQHIFEVAREQWGYENLVNPFRIKIKGTMFRRSRRLKEGELEKLDEACKQCRGLNEYYVPLAMYLAVETGMRLQEIFNLRWQDIDFKERTIRITKSKTDHISEIAGRTIVMTVMAMIYLGRLGCNLKFEERFKAENRVFPMTKDAFKQSWADVVKRADIEDLHFHDLRREAGSRFDEAGLTKAEHDLMMGHCNGDMTSLYITSDLKRVLEKLDRHFLKGRTFEEMIEEQRHWSPEKKTAKAKEARELFATLESTYGLRNWQA